MEPSPYGRVASPAGEVYGQKIIVKHFLKGLILQLFTRESAHNTKQRNNLMICDGMRHLACFGGVSVALKVESYPKYNSCFFLEHLV